MSQILSQQPTPLPGRPHRLRAASKQVMSDLSWCGPDCQIPLMGLDQAFRYCEQLAKSHYENFSVTNLWLPPDIRPHFASIYAYCRWSDDLADEMGNSERSTELLHWWRNQLHLSIHGKSLHPVFIALHHTMRSYTLCIDPFEDLLSAFLQDQTVTSYRDDAQLLDYCRRSANPVGRLILGLSESCSPKSIDWSDSICTGLQIANFCQDVRTDAQRGRVYLPQSRMEQWNITTENWKTGSGNAPKALSSWIDSAYEFFEKGRPLSDVGPKWLRRSIVLFLLGGHQILSNIAKNNYDVWNHSVEVSKRQKAKLILKSIFGPALKGSIP